MSNTLIFGFHKRNFLKNAIFSDFINTIIIFFLYVIYFCPENKLRIMQFIFWKNAKILLSNRLAYRISSSKGNSKHEILFLILGYLYILK